jgi:hypothetical protein
MLVCLELGTLESQFYPHQYQFEMRRRVQLGMGILLFVHLVYKYPKRRVPLDTDHYKWLAACKTAT